MPVLGMGGFFFRARDPDALASWYRQHLGVGAGCTSDPAAPPNEWVWQTLGGPMVFSPFNLDSDYFAGDKNFMMNFRVSDLDGLLAHLRAARIEVITKDEWDDPRSAVSHESMIRKVTPSNCGSRPHRQIRTIEPCQADRSHGSRGFPLSQPQ